MKLQMRGSKRSKENIEEIMEGGSFFLCWSFGRPNDGP